MPYSSCELLLESGSAGDDGPLWPKSGVGTSRMLADSGVGTSEASVGSCRDGTLPLASGSRLSGIELSCEGTGDSRARWRGDSGSS